VTTSAEADRDRSEVRVHSRLLGWLFGVALVITLVIVATNLGEGRAFVELTRHVRPAWLALGVLLQLGTYAADARSWQRVLHRAGEARPLGGFVSLGLAKLFVDQAVPSAGISGTFVVVRGLQRRGIPRATCMAAVVVDLYAYYAAYLVALLAAFAVLSARGELGTPIFVMATAFGVMGLTVVGLLTALTTPLKRFLPPWLLRLRLIVPMVEAVSGANPRLLRRIDLLATSFGYQLLIFAFDAGTVWTMLRGIGADIHPAPVFASFMVSSLARSLGILPGGLGTFDAASVATLHMVGASLAAALTATLLFRGLSFWMPLVPGMLLARRESR
jgi:uncharacterized membrane protein YbhN (UPF0104 family)